MFWEKILTIHLNNIVAFMTSFQSVKKKSELESKQVSYLVK